MNNNIVLNETFSIKGDKLNKFLFDIKTGKKYLINEKQFEILVLCGGALTEMEISNRVEINVSANNVNLFLKKLKKINAIRYGNVGRRTFINLTDKRQLKEVQWEITDSCNLNCLHCYQGKYLREGSDFSLQKCRAVIKEMSALGVERVSLSGGEPLMRKDLFDILKYLQEDNIKVQAIFTNGILISSELLEKIKTLNFKPRFNISLDGVGDESLSIRGFNSKKTQLAYLDTVFKNVLLLKENGFQIRINTILNKLNYLEMEDMYEKLSKVKGLSWSIGFPREMGSCVINKELISIDSELMLDVCKKIIQTHLIRIKNKKNRINLKIQNLFHEKFINNLVYYSAESYVCNYENKESSICLKSNGDILPCSVLFDFVMGNLRKEKLYDIWNSKRMREFKEVKIKDLKGCAECKFAKLCGGGCRATANILKKDIKSNDPLACKFMKYFFKEIKPLLKK
jgi:radical SAM protein with 4Fe4S-binding SPASM domain